MLRCQTFFIFLQFFSIFLTMTGDKLIFFFRQIHKLLFANSRIIIKTLLICFRFLLLFFSSSVCLVLNFSSPGQHCELRFSLSSCLMKSNSKEHLIFFLSEQRNQPKFILRLTVLPRNDFTSVNSLGERSVIQEKTQK